MQHAIIADQALHAAQDRISALEAQTRGDRQAQGGGFLGGGAPWGGQPAYPPQGYAPPPQPQAQSQRGGLLGGLFGGGQPAQPGGFGSFLRTAGTTAAGVAGGEFLFSGLSNLFGGGRGGGFGGGYGAPMENVTINEYGGDQNYGGDPGSDPGGMGDGGYDDGFN